MARYITLFNLTDQGIKSIKQAPERVRQFETLGAQAGCTVIDFYLTLGDTDYVAIFEAPDDETAAKMLLILGSAGNVRSKTLKAFSRDEFEKIVASLP